MRVLIVSPTYPPEPQKIVSDGAETLREQGHNVTVLTGFPNYPAGRLYPGYRLKLCQHELRNGVPVIRVPLYPDHGRAVFKRAINFLSFSTAVATIGPWVIPAVDIIHAVGPPTVGIAAWCLSRIARVPYTCEVQDLWPETLAATGMLRSPTAMRMVGWLARYTYQHAAAIRVISPGFRGNLIARGIPAGKIHTISNWVDADHYQPRAPDIAFAEKSGLARRFNVMFAGTMGQAQGLDTVLQAATLVGDLPDVQFVLAGYGNDVSRLEAVVRERGIANVCFLGRFSEEQMPDLYALADVLLIHLRDDPLFRITIPHKTYTYMASCKPVLAAVEGDAADVIRSANAGLTCKPGDAVALAEVVREFHAMPLAQRQQMAERGRTAACEKYGRQEIVRQVAHMLEAVVTGRRNGSVSQACLTREAG